jgi:putative radical SAM enzyme (TIGR03279 family)
MPKRIPEVGVRVLRVEPGGLAARAGLQPGDRLLRVNGTPLRDLIDFHVLAGEERLAIDLARGCQSHSVELYREWGRDLGLECEPPVPSEISTCANKCVFCFIHQLPRGLRKSLYVKDDDYRLSFLHGNYITLTDLPDEEVQRIVDQRLSPLYVSVHATDPHLRHVLLGKPKTIRGDLMERLARLAAGGIRIHAQIVLCPGSTTAPTSSAPCASWRRSTRRWRP